MPDTTISTAPPYQQARTINSAATANYPTLNTGKNTTTTISSSANSRMDDSGSSSNMSTILRRKKLNTVLDNDIVKLDKIIHRAQQGQDSHNKLIKTNNKDI